MTAQVAANGPISFTDAQGRVFFVPLSSLYFDANGAVQGDRWPLYGDHQALLDDWLEYLQKENLIRAGETPAPAVAMIVKAKTAGAAGNTILLEIDNVHPDPADAAITLFDATVTETNTYAGLTPATLKTTVGAAAGGGSKPGLVFVGSAADPAMPKAGDYPLVGGAANAAAGVDIPTADPAVVAFRLVARSKGAEGNHINVTVKDVTATAFGLVAVWTKPAAGLKPADLAGTFDYEITVDPPAGGAPLAAPAPGDYALAGGADAQVAQPASVTLAASA